MRKVYLVDSENVGDVWVPLLVSSQLDDEVLVFYTLKSPHMNYENVRILKETKKEAVFIKCFEGSNALDFQLVSELGYRLREDLESEYIVISNDTGFDAVVRYWVARNMRVSRLSGKECYRSLVAKRQRREQRENASFGKARMETEFEVYSEAQAETLGISRGEAEPMENVSVTGAEVRGERESAQSQLRSGLDGGVQNETRPDMGVEDGEDVNGQTADPAGKPQSKPDMSARCGSKLEDRVRSQSDLKTEDGAKSQSELKTEDGQASGQDDKRVVKTLFRCISKENLVDFHNALVAFWGEEEGKALYQEIKGSAECTTYWSTLPESSQREKFEMYCALVFEHSDFASDVPEDFAGFLFQANGKRKNLNSLRAALQGQYGKDRGMKYYSLFKSHIKIMNRM